MHGNEDAELNNQESEMEVDFAQEMASLLDEHDYEMPQVGDIRVGTIVSISTQGMIVDLGLKRDGIVQPSDLSKLEEEERQSLQVNDDIPVYILSTEEPDGLLVSVYRAKLNQDWIKAQEQLDNGELFQGEVIGHNRGGVIVPFGRLRGFVPASHLTTISRNLSEAQRSNRLSQLKGEILPLKVIEVDRRRRRLVLSQREAQKEWEERRRRELLEKLNEGDTVKGRVSGLRDFGAFVDLGGADGLVHISELAWHRVNHPREVVRVGEEVEVYVLKLDKKEERISLSRKKILPNPWSLVGDKYDEGQLIEGRITRIVSYGAFVEVEPGVEGLLHVSQLARGKVDNPNEMINEGERHLLRIVSIDIDRQRMGLSLKQVTDQEQIEWMAQQAPPAEPEFEVEPAEAELVDEAVVASVAAAVADDETVVADAEE